MKLKLVAPIHYFYDHPRDTLPETMKLDKGLVLTKFDPQLIDVVTSFFTDLYSGHDIQDLQNCKFCVIYEFDSETEDKDKAQQRVHHFIESLRIIRPTRAACSTFILSTDKQGGHQAEGASQRSSTIYLTYGEQPGASHFRTEDAEKIKKYYSRVTDLYEKHQGKYNRVLNSFIFFQLGYLTHYAKLRIVPFATALESLFNTSEQEVGYSLRIRCAAFLGNTKEDRENIAKKVKDIYELRSAAVHGSSLPKKVLKDPEKSNSIIRDSEDLCRRCIQKIFDEDLIDSFSQPNEKLIPYLDAFVMI